MNTNRGREKEENFGVAIVKQLKIIVLGGVICGVLGLIIGYVVGHIVKLALAGVVVGMIVGEFVYALSDSNKESV